MSVLLSRSLRSQCRWPVCEAVGPATLRPGGDMFGGRRICGEPVSAPTSYCAEHRLRVYERTTPIPRPYLDGQPSRPAPVDQPELTEIFAS